MKRVSIVIGLIVLLIGGSMVFGKPSSKQTPPQNLGFDTVQQAVKNGAKLYDVRTAEEYKAGHFAGAINWTLQDIEAGKLPDVAKDAKMYIYCRSGNRSNQAKVILEKAGYTNVKDLGGLSDVEAIGGKLAT